MKMNFTGPQESVRKKTKAKKPLSIDRMMWILLWVLETLLGIRFLLSLGKVDMGSGFLLAFGKVSGAVIAPLNALLGLPQNQGSGFEVTTLVAMGVYAAMFWIVISLSGSQSMQSEVGDQEPVARIEE
jgi:hypothetical protein